MNTTIRLVGTCFFLFWGATHSYSQNEMNVNVNSATVQSDRVVFVFKIDINDEIKWYSDEINVGSLEYKWTSSFNLGGKTYSAGFNLFKYPGAEQKYGTLSELIEDGQTNVFENRVANSSNISQEMVAMTGFGTIIRGVKINSTIDNDSLIVTILEKQLINLFLIHKPEAVFFATKTPDSDYNSFSVKVNYQ